MNKQEIESIQLNSVLSQENFNKPIHWIHIFDESLGYFLQQEIKLLWQKQDIVYIKGKELNLNWIENQFLSLSLFDQKNPIIINDLLSAKKKDINELFKAIDNADQPILLFSHGKNNKDFIKDFVSHSHYTYTEFKAPAFWDYDKLIKAIFNKKGLELSSQSAQFLSSKLGQDISEILNALDICKINFQKQISHDQLLQIFKGSRHIDRFRLAEIFNQKNIIFFLEELVNCDVSLEDFRSFFSFMSGHCVKIIDPSYTQKKKKLSKYDKQIQVAHSKWSLSQLDYMIEKFSEWMITCKKKEDIKTKLLETYFLFKKKQAK